VDSRSIFRPSKATLGRKSLGDRLSCWSELPTLRSQQQESAQKPLYVDNNSTPTIDSNLLEENAFLSLYTSSQDAKRSVALLCATIDPTTSC
jgi:hypothetical protein